MVRAASLSAAKCIDPSCGRAFALLRFGSLRMTTQGRKQSRMIRLETPALSLQDPAVAKN